MGYDIKVNGPDGIVEIRISGAVSHDEHLKARDELLKICKRQGIRKIMVDVSDLVINEAPSVMPLYEFGSSWAELAKGRPILLAGVLPKDIVTRDVVGFGHTVTDNRGFSTRAFKDAEQARTWLRDTYI